MIILSFADTMMVGHHSTSELGAASFVNNIMNLVIITGTGFSYGLTPIVGGLFGRKQLPEAGQALRCSLLANTLATVIMMAALTILYFNLANIGQPDELLPYMRPYYLVLLASLPFVMLFNAFKQFTDSITETRTSMWILLSGNLLNIIGNYILIYGKMGVSEMGVVGAGVSTLVSRIVMVGIFLAVFLCKRSMKQYREGFFSLGWSRQLVRRLTTLGTPIALDLAVYHHGGMAWHHRFGFASGDVYHISVYVYAVLRTRCCRGRAHKLLPRPGRHTQHAPRSDRRTASDGDA